MNDTAPRFFRMIQDELVDAIVLRIACLTDPPKSTGKPSLSIQQLPSRIQDRQLSKQVADLVHATVSAAEFCRNRRHTTLAHNALDLALGVNKQAFPALTRDNIGKGIEALAKVLNAISFHYLKSTTAFDVVSNPRWCSRTLENSRVRTREKTEKKGSTRTR